MGRGYWKPGGRGDHWGKYSGKTEAGRLWLKDNPTGEGEYKGGHYSWVKIVDTSGGGRRKVIQSFYVIEHDEYGPALEVPIIFTDRPRPTPIEVYGLAPLTYWGVDLEGINPIVLEGMLGLAFTRGDDMRGTAARVSNSGLEVTKFPPIAGVRAPRCYLIHRNDLNHLINLRYGKRGAVLKVKYLKLLEVLSGFVKAGQKEIEIGLLAKAIEWQAR